MTNTTILRGITGSHAYGLNHADSDVDRQGVFVTPARVIAGWDWSTSDETVTNSGPGHDDFTEHEIRKYLRLVIKSNPTATELLWLDSYEVQSVWGNLLIERRTEFLSEKHVRNAYLGYARHQLAKFQDGFKIKHARHTLRLLHQGRHLLVTGDLIVRVPDPQVYFDLADMSPGAVLELLSAEMLAYDEVEKSALPEEPDYALARDIVATVRDLHS